MKIVMVCLGNICRSPLAQGILEKKLNELDSQARVDSAGTSSYHIGEGPDPRSIQVASQYGVDISQQQARQFTTKDFDHFDVIYAMDKSNYDDIIGLTKSELHRSKVRMILNEVYPEESRAVPDPYYDENDGFEKVYHLLDMTCDAVIKNLGLE